MAAVPIALLSLLAAGSAGGTRLQAPRDPSQQTDPEHATRRRLAELRRERALAAHRDAAQSAGGGGAGGPQPLDLVLDESDPSSYPAVFRRGAGGELLPYDPDGDAALGPVEEEEHAPVIHLSFRGAVDAGSDEGTEGEEGGSRSPGGHYWSDRVGFTNFDLARGVGTDEDEDFAAEEVERRAARRQEVRGLRQKGDGSVMPLFIYGEHDDPYESAELIPDLNYGGEEDAGRRLQSVHSKTSHADSFIVSNGTKKDKAKAKEADTSVPVIDSAFPPVNTKIGDRQSFGALVRDVGGSGVRSACVQLQDHVRARSPCLKLKNVGSGRGGAGIYELTLDGFDAFKGQTWSYRIMGKDNSKNRRRTGWRAFEISGPGNAAGETTTGATALAGDGPDATGAPVTAAAPPARLFETVGDEDWPHGGVVQTSTGRVLFFYDGAQFVCSATVLKQPARDRTILLTAGHCAYQHASGGRGRFADYALFVPNQVDTRGNKSDGECENDPLGCWFPAFAVVDYEWSTNSFPRSVAWDYAYYVVPNDVEAHSPGFIHRGQPELTRLLDHLVEPLPVDFEWEHAAGGNGGEFTHGLGYSFDKDPAFRYCAGAMSSKFGIPNYENLWIDVCLMTGGSSGGPWMTGVDAAGRGTVVSVNSWGYATGPGMGGPNFATRQGGKAECLYAAARDALFEDVQKEDGLGGFVVDTC